MSEGLPEVRRIWAVVREASPGRNVIEFTKHDPDTSAMRAALLLTGMLARDGLTLSLDIVSDPKADPDLTGPSGPNGWTPLLAGEADGTRTLLKVADWTGGRGEKPALGYVGAAGATGLVAKAAAFNFNAIKRVDIFTAQSDAAGATVNVIVIEA